MRILLAGATGTIGKRLTRLLHEAGHELFALIRSPKPENTPEAKRARQVIVDVLDAASVLNAVQSTKPQVIINQLTSLPKQYTLEAMSAAAARNKEVRIKGNANLLAAAKAANCKRYLLQSAAFWYAPGPGLADEAEPFAFDASPFIAAGCRNYANLEAAAQESGLEAVVLRYGFWYGDGTWFSREGDVGDQVRRREIPVIGKGEGIWNWVHLEDAAAATSAAVTANPGVYNIVGDRPVTQSVWLPAFARFVGAPDPSTIPEHEALQKFGPDRVYYATKLRGASNDKAKAELAFRPRPLEWLTAHQHAAGM